MFKVWKHSKGVFDELIIIFQDYIKIILLYHISRQRNKQIEFNKEYVYANLVTSDDTQLIVIDVHHSHNLDTNYNPYIWILPDSLKLEVSCQYSKAK